MVSRTRVRKLNASESRIHVIAQGLLLLIPIGAGVFILRGNKASVQVSLILLLNAGRVMAPRSIHHDQA